MSNNLAGQFRQFPYAPALSRQRRGGRWMMLAVLGALALAAALAVIAGVPAALRETRLGATCDAGERACGLELPGGGRVDFDLGPRPLGGAGPLRVRVRVSGMAVRAVEVNMVGVAMHMAETRAQLAGTGEGRFEGELTLPVCSSGPMEWRAEVRVRGWWSGYVAPFGFRSGVQ